MLASALGLVNRIRHKQNEVPRAVGLYRYSAALITLLCVEGAVFSWPESSDDRDREGAG